MVIYVTVLPQFQINPFFTPRSREISRPRGYRMAWETEKWCGDFPTHQELQERIMDERH